MPIFINFPSPTGGSGSGGDVNGPSSSTDNAITRWDGTTGKLIQDSPGTQVQDGGAVESAGFITTRNLSTTVTVHTGQSWIAPSLNLLPGSVIVLQADSQLIIL